MSLVKFQPLPGFDSMIRRMNNMLSEFDRGGSLFNEQDFNSRTLAPRVDIAEDKNTVYIHAELPGLTKEDVKIALNEDRVLTISGEKKQEEKKEDKNFYRIERRYGVFSRSFNVPENVDVSGIEAVFENGVLNITLPKTEPVQPKVTEISIK